MIFFSIGGAIAPLHPLATGLNVLDLNISLKNGKYICIVCKIPLLARCR